MYYSGAFIIRCSSSLPRWWLGLGTQWYIKHEFKEVFS